MAYCMTTYTIGARTYFIQGNQPTDLSSCAYLSISGAEWSKYQALKDQAAVISQLQADYQTLLTYQSQPFDLTSAMAAFAFFFSTVLFFYSVARPAGAILESIRRPLGRG